LSQTPPALSEVHQVSHRQPVAQTDDPTDLLAQVQDGEPTGEPKPS
jgi:hypothetical protein